MSAESGIPTFRGPATGLWAAFDPQKLATPEAFRRDPDTVWAWYEWRRRSVARAQPNAGHVALRALAALPHLEALAVVTQNVDDLHERAGSKDVLHLHGSLSAPRCEDCGLPFAGLEDPWLKSSHEGATRLAPPCCSCGARIRPGVVWFGEGLPEGVWLEALAQIEQADFLLVIGTSGLVYPAAGLADTARRHGVEVASLNPDASVLDQRSALDWQVTAATGLPALVAALQPEGNRDGLV
ncbi:SIR2 family NAD-dependent protein deacylase [Variovorax saccharolyticus]|uniref:SIR2 family NAD-dependent protein deacylase n=1 Tax=Variovorax saccharolyticus TaxID=3053516 RepID=UPI0025770CBA|nr:NAD-dependent protein deacylase [Variovorax sp. J22R187]MDM0022173.1 NAD-dependent protein deacylase [Variovorax sp. J22R187]